MSAMRDFSCAVLLPPAEPLLAHQGYWRCVGRSGGSRATGCNRGSGGSRALGASRGREGNRLSGGLELGMQSHPVTVYRGLRLSPSPHYNDSHYNDSDYNDSDSRGPLLQRASSTPASLLPFHTPPHSLSHSAHPTLRLPTPTSSLCGGSIRRRLSGRAAAYPQSTAPCPGAQYQQPTSLRISLGRKPPQERIPKGHAAYRRFPSTTTTTTTTTITLTTTTLTSTTPFTATSTTRCSAGALAGGAPAAEGASRLLSACLPAALERALGLFGAFSAPAAAVVRWLELPGAEVVCVAAAGIAVVLLLVALVAVVVPTALALASASFRLQEALGASLGAVDREIEVYTTGAWDDRAIQLALPPQRHKSASGPTKGSLRPRGAKGVPQKSEGAPAGHLGGANWRRSGSESNNRNSGSRHEKAGKAGKAGASGARQPAPAQGSAVRGGGAKAAPAPALNSPGNIAAAAKRIERLRAGRHAPVGEAAGRQGLLGALASAVGLVNLVIRAGRMGRRLWGSFQGFFFRGASWAFIWRRTPKP